MRSYVFLAEGFEEIEAITAIDVMRRAGMDVKSVSITRALQVTGAHGITVNADVLYDNTLFGDVDWLVLPGGMPGATNLHDFGPLQGLLRNHIENGGKVAAICAAPAVVLGTDGLLEGRRATCYPGFEGDLLGAKYEDRPVVVDGNVVTGNGPSNAGVWALAIVEEACGKEKADEVANGALFYPRDYKKTDYMFG